MKLLSNLLSFLRLCVSGPAHGDNDWEGKWKRRPVCMSWMLHQICLLLQSIWVRVLRWILRLEVICGSFGTERRLGHLTHQLLLEMSRSIPLSSSQSFLFKKEHLCSTCQLSKSHRLPFPNSDSRCKESFHLVHSDVWGPCPELSFNGMRDFGIQLQR